VTYDRKVYREVARSKGSVTGVQALSVERKSDNAVVVAYAGTNAKDVRNVLADMGIVGDEADFVIKDSIATPAL
jgi:predicted deacylase